MPLLSARKSFSLLKDTMWIKYHYAYLHKKRQFFSNGSALSSKEQSQSEPHKTSSKYEDFEYYRERYIPLTQQAVLHHLIEDKQLLTRWERKNYEKFANSLDTTIFNHYYGILEKLKELYDPIDPDKDTVQTRVWTQSERLDNETWILKRLHDVVERANFHELSPESVHIALQEHDTTEGVRVSVCHSDYAVLKVWALGREQLNEERPWEKSIFKKKINKEVQCFKRVIIALRPKTDHKLSLKLFKNVPVNALEMLLPTGKIEMKTLDKAILGITALATASSIAAKSSTHTVSALLDPSAFITLFAAVGIRMMIRYNSQKNKYYAELNRSLYYKNIANNTSLLATLIDRAEDESLKEALLTYSFLLSKIPVSAREKDDGDIEPYVIDCTVQDIEGWAEDWILKKTGKIVEFNSTEAINLLKEVGVLEAHNNKMRMCSLKAAINNLTSSPHIYSKDATVDGILWSIHKDKTHKKILKDYGTKKNCGKWDCKICPIILNGTTSVPVGKNSSENHNSCQTKDIVYGIWCKRCQKVVYVGETERMIKERMKEHLADIVNKRDTGVGNHFNEDLHLISDFNVIVLSKGMNDCKYCRREKEIFWMKAFKTKTPSGLNKQL